MDVKEAMRDAALIFHDERKHPSPGYRDIHLSRIDQVMKMTVGKYDAALPYTAAARPNLTAMRK
jgi:hypothetical protein